MKSLATFAIVSMLVLGIASTSAHARWNVDVTQIDGLIPGDANLDGQVNEDDWPWFDITQFPIVQDLWPIGPVDWQDGDFNLDGVLNIYDFLILKNWHGTAAKPGDVNNDGSVDLYDFLILKSNFGQPGFWYMGDLNRDWVIDINDFLILKANYGTN